MSDFSEDILKPALVAEMRLQMPGGVLFRLEDKLSAGIPDIVNTWRMRTSWVEVKYADPDFDRNGIQELKMLELSGAGIAVYVIYERIGDVWRTILAHPRHVNRGSHLWREMGRSVPGVNHAWAALQIKRMHTV